MAKFHLWPEEPIFKEGNVELAATLEKNQGEQQRIWFRLPSANLTILPANLDHFVLSVLFTAMGAPADLEIHGGVSPSLLRNLTEFQQAWSLWLPDRYHPVELSASSYGDLPRVVGNDVIMGFSGGVDSSFTAWHHRPNQFEHQSKKLVAGVMVHGFDIPISQPEVFARAADKSRKMLSSIGVGFIPVVTNLRDQRSDWGDSHGAALAACLTLFQGQFNTGLIASSNPYNYLRFPWGSNPITDWMLGNVSFQIINDGSGFDRVDKIRQISQWKEAKQYLRVCWEGEHKDGNCCRCVKCVGAMLIFRAVGQDSLPAFPYDISNREIKRLRYTDFRSMRRNISLLSSENFSPSTLRALKVSLIINRIWVAKWRFPYLKKVFNLFEKWYFINRDFDLRLTLGKRL
jgi:hypothetical protein